MDAQAQQRYLIFRTACNLFMTRRFGQVSMTDISAASNLPPEEVFKYFGNKEDIIFYLYSCINNDWESEVAAIAEAKLEERFRRAIEIKLELVRPYRELLRNLLPSLLTDADLNVFSRQNNVIRVQGLGVMTMVVAAKKGNKKPNTELVELLYLMHWGVLFLSLHEQKNTKATKLLDSLAGWLKELNGAKKIMLHFLLPKMASFFGAVLGQEGSISANVPLAKNILATIFTRRKLLPGAGSCETEYCDQCYIMHMGRVEQFIMSNQPVHMILPAFPAKSPNLNKVLGPLPDMGEEIALLSLQAICTDIKRIYKPGARITICADGRIFADLVQVPDAAVTAYTTALREMISGLGIDCISVVNLEDILPAMDFDEARQYVMDNYAEPLEQLKNKIASSDNHKSMFNGIHRFITDDRTFLEPGKSRSKIKEESKNVAIEVIQRSNAWTRLLGHYYPDAVRLSIHPQSPHSGKIGIRLTRATDEWITPWHGVIVIRNNDYILMKKQDAEALNTRLVYKYGRASHFTENPDL